MLLNCWLNADLKRPLKGVFNLNFQCSTHLFFLEVLKSNVILKVNEALQNRDAPQVLYN
jgi:hypothetical protein